MNETVVEDKVDQVQAVEIEESFEDMNEDNVETDNVERVVRELTKTYAVKPFEVERVSRAETIRNGEMWLKICCDVEEVIEGKVKTINPEGLQKG